MDKIHRFISYRSGAINKWREVGFILKYFSKLGPGTLRIYFAREHFVSCKKLVVLVSCKKLFHPETRMYFSSRRSS